METILKIFIFTLGSLLGSFLNVCIYRMPRKESVIRPGSHCPDCQQKIVWHDNIPLISYIVLKGRCRYCRKRISFRYFIVEFITAGMILFLYTQFSLTLFFWIYAALAASLIVVSFIDIAIREIPDEISLGGIAIGLILSFIFPSLHGAASRLQALLSSGLGLLVGGGSIYLTGIIGNIIFRKESMGGGDVKLMAMIGTIIGWKLAFFTFFLAPFFGAAVGIVLKIRTGESLIPYGPFLSLACLISIVWGEQIIDWLL